MISLHSVMECDNSSMSIIICLVWLNIVTEDVMLTLDECVMFMRTPLSEHAQNLLEYIYGAEFQFSLRPDKSSCWMDES